ncbi:MAG: IPT/TIG domain-containing protein, partial [Acidobacteriota bacterium]|nr:IPT/TIG domain-containing protein [Acidobacteriota bacterium]
PYTVVVNNEAGTIEAGDPAPVCLGPNGRNGSTWFEFTPAAAGTYRFSPCGAEAVTVISVYTGAACGPYAAVPQACRGGSPSDWNCEDPASTPYVSVAANAGQTLRVLLSTNTPTAGGRAPLTVTLASTAPDAPRLKSVVDGRGSTAGGTSVIVVGSGFTDRAVVFFGGTPATDVLVSGSGVLTARVPAHAAGSVDVVVTVPGVGTGTLKNGFAFENPPPSPCLPGPTTLCLNGGRFRAEVVWRVASPNTQSGQAAAVPLTGDTGYFWFFSSNNIELVVKVVDGRAVNGKFWVFYGALSNVEYEITVTDSQTGEIRVYTNPAGRLASVADTTAF